MLRTMTVGAAARWAGVSPRMLGLMLAGRLIDPTSELDVEIDGLPLDVIESMPGRPGVGCGVAAGAEVRGPVREAVRGARCAGADEVHPATEEAGRQPRKAAGAEVPRPWRGASRRGASRAVPRASWRAGRSPQEARNGVLIITSITARNLARHSLAAD